MNHEIDDLTPDEEKALKKLAVEMQPPSRLQKKIVTAMREHDLIIDKRYLVWKRVTRLASAFGAAAILLAAGIILGVWWGAWPGVSNEQAKFILVLRSGHGELAGDEASRVREYGDWARNLSQRGLFIDAEKLREKAYVVRSSNGTLSVREADTTAAESIQGYFLIRADGRQQALEIAQECPHVRYGGSVEVRQIDTGPE